MTQVSFVINITGDNNQTESGPATITNEVFTINAAPGIVVSAGGPQGYTTTGTGTSTATVKGTGETSFTISAGVEYTDAEAGSQSVTCNGTVYFSDNTQANGSGAVQVTAVAVDSVALADNPQNVVIGQTLTRSDFTITTTPGGFGNYQFPGTTNYLVDWSMSPQSTVQVGDNTVTASCGDTSASVDVVGVSAGGAWGDVSNDDPSGGPDGSDDVAFNAAVQGGTGTYQITGGDFVGADLSGPVPANNGEAVYQDDGGGGDATLQVGASSPTGGTEMASAAGTVAPAGLFDVLGGIVKAGISLAVAYEKTLTLPPGPLVASVSPTAAAAQAYGPFNVASATTTVSCTPNGRYLLLGTLPVHCDNPSVTLTSAPPNPLQITSTNALAKQLGSPWDTQTVSTLQNPQTGNFGANPLPAWTAAPNKPTDQEAGKSIASCGLSGDYDTVQDSCLGGALTTAPGWSVFNNAQYVVKWYH